MSRRKSEAPDGTHFFRCRGLCSVLEWPARIIQPLRLALMQLCFPPMAEREDWNSITRHNSVEKVKSLVSQPQSGRHGIATKYSLALRRLDAPTA